MLYKNIKKENKKIKNATECWYDGIKFKSLFEVTAYQTLKLAGFDVRYEQDTFSLIEGFKPTIEYYKGGDKKKQGSLQKVSSKVRDWTYTPDFTIKKGDYLIIIEVKGKPNDTWANKCKMFRRYLESVEDFKPIFIEIYNKKNIAEAIDIINNL